MVRRFFFGIETSIDKPVNIADHQAYVRYEDYVALEAECARLRQKVTELEGQADSMQAQISAMAWMP